MLTVLGWIVVIVIILWALGGVFVVGAANLFWLLLAALVFALLVAPRRHRHY